MRSAATRSRRLSCSTSATRRSRRSVLSWMMRVRRPRSLVAPLLVEQLGGVADRRQRIADLVRDVGGQPAERGELELLRLLARARHVLDEHHREALLGAGIEQARAHLLAARLAGRADAAGRPPAVAPGAPALRRSPAARRASASAAQRLRCRAGACACGLCSHHAARRRSSTSTPSCMSAITSWLTRIWLASARPRSRARRSLAARRCASQPVAPAVAK